MKNNKGQVGIGGLILAAITIIVGVILLVASAQNVGDATNTISVANDSLGTASNDTTVYLTSYRAISSVVIYNGSDAVVPSTNYTVTNNVVYEGALAVSVLPTSGAVYNYTGYEWNISGTAQPTGYIDDAGGRAVAGLIIIFFALAIAVVSLVPTLKSKILESIKR